MDKKVILAVDDEPSHLFLIGKILRDYTVIPCSNASEMWQILNDKLPDLILMDVMMPGNDGFETVSDLSQNARTMDIPVLFISAKTSGEDVSTGLEIGGSDYIKKPFDKLELIARIKVALRKKEKEIELRRQTMTDPLTKLYNRRYFYSALDNQLAYARRNKRNISIALIDLDKFKLVNDTFGHLAGDYILQVFSEILMNRVRQYDVVARFGGEEFTILFFDCDKKTANTILSRIKDEIYESEYQFESDLIQFTFSAGIVDLPDFESDGIKIDDLLKIADQRLYKSKDTGRNRITIN